MTADGGGLATWPAHGKPAKRQALKAVQRSNRSVRLLDSGDEMIVLMPFRIKDRPIRRIFETPLPACGHPLPAGREEGQGEGAFVFDLNMVKTGGTRAAGRKKVDVSKPVLRRVTFGR